MGVRSGFFGSTTHDRRYFAEDFATIFDGIILDGVFASIGTALITKAGTGNTVNLGEGKAWFDHTWTWNDAILPVDFPESHPTLNRIDTLVLDVNKTEAIRDNQFMVVPGVPASTPSRAELLKTWNHTQYALCTIYRKAGSIEITNADITNIVGTDETPFITGVLEMVSMEELLGKWQDELDQFVIRKENEMDQFMNDQYLEYQAWFRQVKDDFLKEQLLFESWQKDQKASFEAWFAEMKGKLSEDAAGHLQLELDKNEINDILNTGFVDGNKVFSEDGTTITTTASDGRKIVKVFSEGFSVMTAKLYTAQGGEVATQVKKFAADGKTISTTVTYI